ncbi:MAG: hypothetical protein ABIS50_22815 [Luteolibacter sp.]|uniref:hypothetical protein n=1 Tax=Luteolibacter sp. TaxID=1962973 RepID=UPI0032648574
MNQGVFNYIETDDLAELTILNARTAYVYAHGRSRIDLYDSKNITAEAQANASAQLMIHGGRFDRVYTWPLGGTIELDGYLVTGSLTANDGGILRQNGGRSQSLSSADGGLAILDQGTVQEYMGSSGRSTLVIAGGIPPEEDIRLFSQARVLVFHSGAAIQGKTITEKHSKLILADLDEKGISSDYSSISTVLTLDGHDRKAFFSAWNHDWPNKWTGSLELIQLNDELYVEILPGTRMALLAFRVPRTVVIQPQVSKDGGSWEPLGDPIFGDGAIHTAESRLHGDEKQTFRLHISNNS